MEWWQQLITSVVLLVAGAAVGYLLNRRGMQAERDATEQRQLRHAMQGLLTELNANLKLAEKGADRALLPRLTKDMWQIHRGRISDFPLEIQTTLYEAYTSIDYVNAVVDIRADYGTRDLGPGAWDTRYSNECKKARDLMKKAKNNLERWLKQAQQGASLKGIKLSKSAQDEGETLKLLK